MVAISFLTLRRIQLPHQRGHVGSNLFLGVFYNLIGGFASATNFIPFRQIKRWSWEVYWVIQGFAAWIIAPAVMALLFVPHLGVVLAEAWHTNPHNIGLVILFGALWGVGGLTFGLAIRYLGFALGYSIALGLCMVFGTLVPPIYHGQILAIAHTHSGQVTLFGVLICFIAVAVNGAAGLSKEKEIDPETMIESGEQDFSFGKGIVIAILAGLMSAFFAFGLDAGAPIAAITKPHLLAAGRLDIWQNLPVLIVILWGGFLTNVVWSAVLIFKNSSFRQFAGEPGVNPMRAAPTSGDTLVDFDPLDASTYDRIAPHTLVANYLFAALAGIIWYFQFFFNSMAKTKMGIYDFSSWTLLMASIIIFATLWGLLLKEWKGTSPRTKALVTVGLALLVGSILIIGYGNYLLSLHQ
jgi:L-rhamnose-H+ transport protein